MAISCKFCGKENPDGSMICESCGNMLVDIFSTAKADQVAENQPYQKSDVSVDSLNTAVSGQEQNIKSQDIKIEQNSQLIQQTDISMGNLTEYLFKINSLFDINDFVKLARDSRNDVRLTADDKDEVTRQLRKRAIDVFGEEINYYEDKGTFFGNLGRALVWLILGLILGVIFTPLGIICYILMSYFVCKAIARILTFPRTTRAASIVKKLKQCGVYKS